VVNVATSGHSCDWLSFLAGRLVHKIVLLAVYDPALAAAVGSSASFQSAGVGFASQETNVSSAH
jgi:hypothetical protein